MWVWTHLLKHYIVGSNPENRNYWLLIVGLNPDTNIAVWVQTRAVTLNIDQKNKKSQIIAYFILMKYENANPWFCSKCSPSLAEKLWIRKFNVLLKGQIISWICSVFQAIFTAILLLNVGRMCNYGNYIILMTFYKQKKLSIAFSSIDKEKFLSDLSDKEM